MLQPIIEQVIKEKVQRYIEIIIVDNNSRDNTKRVVSTLQLRYRSVNVLYFVERLIGISYARNTGVTQSQGTTIIFIDDDTLVAPNWLETALQLLCEHQNTNIITGKVALPNKLKRNTLVKMLQRHDSLWSLGIVDHGIKSCEIKHNWLILINNTLIKRRIFQTTGLFDTQFGSNTKKNGVYGGEDVDFFNRVLCSSHVLYIPALRATHQILPNKLTMEYLTWRYHENGKEMAQFRYKYEKKIQSRLQLHFLTYFYKMIDTFKPWVPLYVWNQESRQWHTLRSAFFKGYLARTKQL